MRMAAYGCTEGQLRIVPMAWSQVRARLPVGCGCDM